MAIAFASCSNDISVPILSLVLADLPSNVLMRI